MTEGIAGQGIAGQVLAEQVLADGTRAWVGPLAFERGLLVFLPSGEEPAAWAEALSPLREAPFSQVILSFPPGCSDTRAVMGAASARTAAILPHTPPGQRPIRRWACLGVGEGGLWARLAAGSLAGLSGVIDVGGRLRFGALTPDRPAQPLDLLLGVRGGFLGHYGEIDPETPPAHVAALEQRLSGMGLPWQVFRYPEAGARFWDLQDGCPAARARWIARSLHFLQWLAVDAP